MEMAAVVSLAGFMEHQDRSQRRDDLAAFQTLATNMEESMAGAIGARKDDLAGLIELLRSLSEPEKRSFVKQAEALSRAFQNLEQRTPFLKVDGPLPEATIKELSEAMPARFSKILSAHIAPDLIENVLRAPTLVERKELGQALMLKVLGLLAQTTAAAPAPGLDEEHLERIFALSNLSAELRALGEDQGGDATAQDFKQWAETVQQAIVTHKVLGRPADAESMALTMLRIELSSLGDQKTPAPVTPADFTRWAKVIDDLFAADEKRRTDFRDAEHEAAVRLNALGNEARRDEFFRAVRRGVPYVEAAKAIGSTAYLVLCRMAQDEAFRDELKGLIMVNREQR